MEVTLDQYDHVLKLSWFFVTIVMEINEWFFFLWHMCTCIELSSSPIWTSLYITNPLHHFDIQFQHISSLQCNFHFIEDYGYNKSEGIINIIIYTCTTLYAQNKYKWDYVIVIWNNMHACHGSVNFKLYPHKKCKCKWSILERLHDNLPSHLHLNTCNIRKNPTLWWVV